MSGARRFLMGSAGSDGPTFFGHYSMLREFWPEDPNWTLPGSPPANIDTLVDNGTMGYNLSRTGGAAHYTESGINGKPSIDYNAGAGAHKTTSGATTGTFSVITVAQKVTTGLDETVTDAGTSNNAFTQIKSSTWRFYNNSGALTADGGTSDNNPHVMVTVFKTNDSRMHIDGGAAVISDTSGTLGNATGFTIGANYAVSGGHMNGYVAYCAMYDGDITVASGYSDWIDDIKTYYAI